MVFFRGRREDRNLLLWRLNILFYGNSSVVDVRLVSFFELNRIINLFFDLHEPVAPVQITGRDWLDPLALF